MVGHQRGRSHSDVPLGADGEANAVDIDPPADGILQSAREFREHQAAAAAAASGREFEPRDVVEVPTTTRPARVRELNAERERLSLIRGKRERLSLV